MKQRLLDKHDVAHMLGLKAETVARMAARGDLPCLKVAGRYRFEPDAIESWLTERRRPSTTRGGCERW